MAHSRHHAAKFRCPLLGVKRTLGRCSLNGRAARKKAASKKIADTEGVSFLRFQIRARGPGGGLYAVFPDRRAISLLFFPRGGGASAGASAVQRGSPHDCS